MQFERDNTEFMVVSCNEANPSLILIPYAILQALQGVTPGREPGVSPGESQDIDQNQI